MDWMHNFVVSGIVNTEIAALMHKAREVLGVRYEDIDRFVCADWVWPSWQTGHKAIAHTPEDMLKMCIGKRLNSFKKH